MLLAKPIRGEILLDPFCGTGTIPVEAKLAYPGVTVIASDLDPFATKSAQIDASAAGVDISFAVSDAARLSLRHSEISRVVTNPPWGLSVQAAGALRGSFGPFWDELSRIMRFDGRIVFLAHQTGLAPPKYAPFQVVERNTVRVSGPSPTSSPSRQGLPETRFVYVGYGRPGSAVVHFTLGLAWRPDADRIAPASLVSRAAAFDAFRVDVGLGTTLSRLRQPRARR